MDPMAQVAIIVLTCEDNDQIHIVEAHVSKESAEAAAKTLDIHESYTLEIKMLELKSIIDIDSPPKPSSKSKKTKKVTKATKVDTESEEDEDESSDVEGDMAKSIKDARQTLPNLTDAIPNALDGLTFLFTGIMEKNRKTNQAAVVMFGGKLTSNVKFADYVVLGAKPGAKKLEDIAKHNAETISEKEFFEMLNTGVSKERRDRMAAKAEPPKKKQKK